MTPEEKAREQIDAMLVASGWLIQDYKSLNFSAGRGVAVREVPLKTGPCDYLLLVDRKPVGVVEAKKTGTTLSAVADQSSRYASNLPDFLAAVSPSKLPFLYESTGVETFFRDERDAEPRSRSVFTFHRPETLAEWLSGSATLRKRLQSLPPLPTGGMRDCQIEAITNLEKSFSEARPRALVQMATGVEKTYTACAFAYRLIKNANAKRIFFLVDRSNLGRQAKGEFDQFITPDTGREFTELYNVQHLTSNKLDDVSRVTICTIQRLYSMLRGEELDEDIDEKSGFEIAAALADRGSVSRSNVNNNRNVEISSENKSASLLRVTDPRSLEVAYNPAIPIETFDFIITDECHSSIYGLWRQVLEYFDAFLIGLTATPSKQTIGFFNQNLVTEYNPERAVADGVNVGYEGYRIKTQVTEQGGKVEKGFYGGRTDMNASFLIPTGLHRSAQGCRVREATLEKRFNYLPRPQRGCDRFVRLVGSNPFRVVEFPERFPRVARVSQPWADGHYLVGVISPLAEQTWIVAEVERRLSVVEELESVVSANFQRATRLRQSILQKAFTGELK